MRYLIFFFFFSLMTATNAQNIDKGLVAHYLFNGDVEDKSGNKNNGRMNGGLEFADDRFGNQCGALLFNGRDGYVDVPNSKSLQSPTRKLTIGVWFRLGQGAGAIKWLTVVCKSDIRDELPQSPQYRLQTTNQTISINTEFTEKYVKDVDYNVWHHYTVVYDGQSVKTYLDGRNFFEYDYANSLTPNNMPLEIGRDMPGGLEYFAGSLDELRIYNRALSDKEVMTIFQNQSEKTSPKPCTTTPPPPPPPAVNPPTVNITVPTPSPYATENQEEEITATIENIKNKKDIIFKVNNQEITAFKFNAKRQLFTATVNLEQGYNICEITATNKDGSASDKVIINYTQKAVVLPPVLTKNPPIITIQTPRNNPHTSPKQKQIIRAKIEHISNKNQIEFSFNAQRTTNFSFDARRQILEAEVSLDNGFNIFEIVATNKDGKDDDAGRIRYEPPVVVPDPPAPVNPTPPTTPIDLGEIEVVKEFKVDVEEIEIVCFDHQKADGDIVSILVNGKVIVDKEMIETRSVKEIRRKITLLPNQEYIIVSKAWNLGKFPPNTMTMELYKGSKFAGKVVLESEIGKSEAIRLTYEPKN